MPVFSAAKIKEDRTFEIVTDAGHLQVRAMLVGAANDVSQPWRLNRVVLNDIDVGDTGIDVPANGTVDNVIVEMTDRTYEVTGRVTDGSGKVVRDCTVIVFAQDPSRWTMQTRYTSVGRPKLDDPQYRVRLLPGDYYAVAMRDVESGAWTDPDFLSRAREHATKLTVSNAKQTLDLTLTPTSVY